MKFKIIVPILAGFLLVAPQARAGFVSDFIEAVGDAVSSTVEVIVDGLDYAFSSIQEALDFLEEQINEVKEAAPVLDQEYWENNIEKAKKVNLQDTLEGIGGELTNLRESSVDTVQGIEIGGDLGAAWERGKDWVSDRFSDSPAKGPRMTKENATFKLFRQISPSLNAGITVGLTLLVNNASSPLRSLLDHTVTYTFDQANNEEEFCVEGICVIGARQELERRLGAGVVICEPELFELARTGLTGLHMVQVDEQEYCRLAHQHKSDRFSNGYARTRGINACTLEWQSIRAVSNGKNPSLFRCVDYRDLMSRLEAEMAAELDRLFAELNASLEEDYPDLEDVLTESVEETALEELEKAETDLVAEEANQSKQMEQIAEKIVSEQAAQVPVTDQIDYLRTQIVSFDGKVKRLADVALPSLNGLLAQDEDGRRAHCGSSLDRNIQSLDQDQSLLVANLARMNELIESSNNAPDEFVDQYFDALTEIEKSLVTYSKITNLNKQIKAVCQNQDIEQSFDDYANRFEELRASFKFYSAAKG